MSTILNRLFLAHIVTRLAGERAREPTVRWLQRYDPMRGSREIVRSVVTLARNDLAAIEEDVESREQSLALRALDCE